MIMGKGKVIFIKNAAIMTATSLALRLVGMVFRVWMANTVGAEGMGLYQQIFSVYVFVSVFASAGVGLAVTRLISEEMTLGCRGGVELIVKRSMAAILATALVSAGAVFFGAYPISVYIMSDIRAVSSLKIMSLSLPFMGASAVIKGYFFARKKAGPTSSAQLFEQAVRIGVIFCLFSSREAEVSVSCSSVLFGDAVAEASSCLYLLIRYSADRKNLRRLTGRARPPYKISRELFRISAPIAGGRYLNSFLRTAENILVPQSLEKFGMSREAALSAFGGIKGMVLPLLLFPAGLLSSVTSLLVPEMSEAAVSGQRGRIRYAAERSITLTFLSSFPFAVGFFFAAEPLALLIYGDSSVGSAVKALSPLVPLMYIDSVSDALLKALDRQGATFRHALLDSLGRIAAVLALLAPFGMPAFIGIMYASNLFTSLMNLRLLICESGAKISLLKGIILPTAAALVGGLAANGVASAFDFSGLVYIILQAVCIAACYLPLVFALGLHKYG